MTDSQVDLGPEAAFVAAEAHRRGFASTAAYLLHLHGKATGGDGVPLPLPAPPPPFEYGATGLGRMLCGDSLGYLQGEAPRAGVDLVVTSPPFALVRKKAYGNEDADAYLDWFRPYAAAIKRVLKDTGSLVVDIGGAWEPGRPSRSLYHFKLLVMLVEEFGFHLCQEHFWWNPSKLPSPAEWVNVKRCRVKDAVNAIWWLSPTPWPKADNRRVLAPYSAAMHALLRDGYTPATRPSGHQISGNFMRDNGGSVPPNLLAIANTESNGTYQDHCKARGVPVHPARFPAQLPEYFVRFLTDPGDLVVDPFAGSCVTGEVAEALGRHWVCCELSRDYLEGAKGRFKEGRDPAPRDRHMPYSIYQPCALSADEVGAPLMAFARDADRLEEAQVALPFA